MWISSLFSVKKNLGGFRFLVLITIYEKMLIVMPTAYHTHTCTMFVLLCCCACKNRATIQLYIIYYIFKMDPPRRWCFGKNESATGIILYLFEWTTVIKQKSNWKFNKNNAMAETSLRNSEDQFTFIFHRRPNQYIYVSVLQAFRCYNNIINRSCGCWSLLSPGLVFGKPFIQIDRLVDLGVSMSDY